MVDKGRDRDTDSGDFGGPPDEGFLALLSLHAHAGRVDPSRVPGFTPLPIEDALHYVAAAPKYEISVAARLEALHELAKLEFPGFTAHEDAYLQLAATVVEGKNLTSERLLDDLLSSTRADGGGFQATPSRQAMAHHEAAFIGQDVCTTRRVKVGGLDAVWIFSEFETDAPIGDVAKWLDPQHWSDWGRLFFKKMEIVDSNGPIQLPPLGTEHWHAQFHEVVQFPWRQLSTLLHCDYWRDGDRAAGMTYDLSRSVDSQIDVDRGFLLVTKVAPGPSGVASGTQPTLRVKVLKVVGFTEDVWDYAAEWVCPFWTEWIRGALERATSSVPKDPSHAPEGSGAGPWRANADAWLGFLTDSAGPYLDLAEEVTSRVSSSKTLDPAACLVEGGQYWSLLAKDWAKAWSHGLKTLDDVARDGLGAGFGPPVAPDTTGPAAAVGTATAAAPPRTHEGTIIPLAGLGPNDRPVCTDLTSIEAGASTIASRDVVVTVRPFEGGYAVQLRTTVTSASVGLYVGQLKIADGQPLVPVQLYISRATGV